MLPTHARRLIPVLLTGLLTSGPALAAPSLTLYNGQFAVVRDNLQLTVSEGDNRVQYQEITRQLEPDSVVLRSLDPAWPVRVLEQNYLANAVSESLLLHYFEGKTIDFQIQRNQKDSIVPGRIVRSGFDGGNGIPIIEIEGKTRFGLPGTPLFPPLKDDTLLKPALQWQLHSTKAGTVPLEIAYLTGGLDWKADYNVVAQDSSDQVNLHGWVTFTNQSGQDFGQAKVKLMAGDVNREQPAPVRVARAMMAASAELPEAKVTEQSLDEFHLYSLPRPLDLRDGETKQVEFLDAGAVKASKYFIYDGATARPQDDPGAVSIGNRDASFGTRNHPHVWIMREFANTEANQLGVPLPRGRVRFYQQGSDGQLEFIGENTIDHTPRDETVRLYTGNAFDILGGRERTDYQINSQENWIRESFRVTLKNRKKEKIKVTVREHLARGKQWNIEQSSQDFTRLNAQTVEFRVSLKPDEEKDLTYSVHYRW